MNDDLDIRVLDDAAEMRRVMTLFNQVWGSTTPLVGVELLRAIEHAGGYVAAAYADDQVVGGSLGFLGRHHGAAVAAQPHHRHPARRPPHRARAGDEAAPAGVGRRPRAGVGHVDVRPARAPQRLVQPRRARRPGPRVPRRLLRPDRRRHQRRRRERPAARRLAASATAATRRRRRHRPAPSPCRRRRTSSCCAAPTGPAADGVAPPPPRPSSAAASPPAAASSASPTTASTSWWRHRERRRSASCGRSGCRSSPRSRPASACRPSRRILLVRAEVDVDGVTSPRAGASASPATSRRTRPSTSTAPRSSCARC